MPRLTSSKSFLGGMASLCGGTVLAQGITIVGGVVLARLYGPYDFGNYGLFLAALGIANTVTTLTYSDAIVSARKSADAIYLLILSVSTTIPMAAFSSGVLYLFMRWNVLGYGQLPIENLYLFLPAVFGYSGFVVLRQMYVRQARFGSLSRELLIHSLCRLSGQVLCWGVFIRNSGLVLGETLARIVVMALMWRTVWSQVWRIAKITSLTRIVETAKKYKQFPLYGLPSNLIDNVAQMLPVPLVVLCFGGVAGGLFVFAQRIFAVPISLVGRSVADVLHRRLNVERCQSDGAALRLLDRIAGYLFIAGVGPCAVAMLVAPRVVPWIFGDQWTDAGRVVAAVAPLGLAQFAISPLSQCFSVYHAHRLKLVYDWLSLIVCVLTLAGAAHANMDFVSAVHLFSTANVAAYIVYFVLMRQAVADPTRIDGVVKCAG